jgi:peroxiredoxin
MDPVVRMGDTLPDFTLSDLADGYRSLQELRGRIAVLCFWSAECPWSQRADEHILSLRPAWGERVAVWNIASNANEPLEHMLAAAERRQAHPVLRDEDQRIADLLGAVTTPHVIVLDASGRLRYAGALDDVTFRQQTPTRSYLAEAVEALLEGQDPDPVETPSYGCAITRHSPEVPA